MLSEQEAQSMEVTKEITNFANNQVEISSPTNGETMDVLHLLSDSEEFHGDPNVHHLVRFSDTFKSLIGRFDESQSNWNPDELPGMGIVILEHYFDEAAQLMGKIDNLAQQAVKKPKFYDDLPFCKEYFYLAKTGYDMLIKHQGEFGVEGVEGTPVSLERAGLVSTRLAMGLDTNQEVDNEFRVVTKRTHLDGEAESNLSVTVKWRDREALYEQIAGKNIVVSDFVNPASGASVAALALAARYNGAKPKSIEHRSISLTKQGVVFNSRALEGIGIETIFMSVGVADELNEHYYLIGKRNVGDAGHFLRHYMPADYVQ
jgi:hypothetical protein